uniref:(northern house mosquito) hypothetical protein n=1 Tax=Culex pipiens TaxID=7175 RepID=A0A8D8ETJ8_CULPI
MLTHKLFFFFCRLRLLTQTHTHTAVGSSAGVRISSAAPQPLPGHCNGPPAAASTSNVSHTSPTVGVHSLTSNEIVLNWHVPDRTRTQLSLGFFRKPSNVTFRTALQPPNKSLPESSTFFTRKCYAPRSTLLFTDTSIANVQVGFPHR